MDNNSEQIIDTFHSQHNIQIAVQLLSINRTQYAVIDLMIVDRLNSQDHRSLPSFDVILINPSDSFQVSGSA